MNFKRGLFTLVCTHFIALLLLSPPPRASAQTVQQKAQASQTAAHPVEEKFERGKRHYHQGDAESALPLLRDATQTRKKDAEAWLYYGLALNHAGKAKDARKAFEKALKLKPDDARARTGIAYSLLLLHKPRDAEREARRALSLDPKIADAHYLIGVIRYREDKVVEANEEAEAALRIQPDLPAAAVLSAEALLSIYVDESGRVGEKYPLALAFGEEERKATFEKRAAELEPLKARMREAAARMEAFVKSRPDDKKVGEWREQAETLRFYSRKPGEGGGEAQGIFRTSEVSKRAIITYKPEPGYTEEARRNNTSGVVRLRVILAPDGRVRHILVIKGLPDGLTEKSVAAARNIRFTPATINGHRVAQYVVLEYNFNIY
ncbi:MAG TPA: TonB family protein [Pyrinomonadaceae bacterium]|nr:TonB family protein [Pyrinomonadaceae bacterium]